MTVSTGIRCLAFAGLMSGCSSSDRDLSTRERMGAPRVSLAALRDDPRRYDGETVRIVGHIETRLDDQAVVLRGDGLLWAARIPVVAQDPEGFEVDPPPTRARVEVRGIARARPSPELARDRGAEVARLVGQGPYVVATSIRSGP